MKPVVAILLASLLATPVAAQEALAAEEAPIAAPVADAPLTEETAEVEPGPVLAIYDAAEISLAEFQWLKRPIVVFADTPADPRFTEQMELLTARPGELIERDVVIITDTNPAARSEIRLKLRPRGFQLTLIGKDGGVKLRKPFPWDIREISRVIDKMPMRQQEIRDQKLQAAQ